MPTPGAAMSTCCSPKLLLLPRLPRLSALASARMFAAGYDDGKLKLLTALLPAEQTNSRLDVAAILSRTAGML